MNVERVEALARLLHASRAQELIIEADGWRVGLRKAPAARAPSALSRDSSAASREPRAESPDHGEHWITAPLVGIFRQGHTRLRPGDEVAAGQAVGAIESMKILNPLVSEMDGEVTEVLVEDGQPVEFGQPLLQIRTPTEE